MLLARHFVPAFPAGIAGTGLELVCPDESSGLNIKDVCWGVRRTEREAKYETEFSLDDHSFAEVVLRVCDYAGGHRWFDCNVTYHLYVPIRHKQFALKLFQTDIDEDSTVSVDIWKTASYYMLKIHTYGINITLPTIDADDSRMPGLAAQFAVGMKRLGCKISDVLGYAVFDEDWGDKWDKAGIEKAFRLAALDQRPKKEA